MNRTPAHEALGLRFDRHSPAEHIALAFSLAALWLLGRRYAGVAQDASIYILQGLRRIDPGSFGKDLFFAYGSQDAFTVFPSLYAPLIDALGAGGAALAVTITGQIAFFAAAAALAFRIASGPARWWCLALLAAISGYYGGAGVMRLAEPFATARSYAEPLVLAALVFTFASRHLAAWSSLALATALHPLVAAAGIAVVVFWHAWERRWLFWAALLVIALAAAFASAWPAITLPVDAPWRAVILERSPQLFIAEWQLPDWSRFLWGLCVTGIAVRFIEAPARRLVLAGAATGLAGVAASWITVDLLGLALATGLQFWRTHWLMHLLAIVLVPVAVTGLWRSGNTARAAAACLAASCCFGRAELPAAALLAGLAVLLDAFGRRWPGRMGESATRACLLAALGAASVGLLFEIQSRLPPAYAALQAPHWTDYVHAAASVGGLLPLAALLWLAAYSRFALLGAGAAVVVFALSVAAWDARKPWPRFIEHASAGANPFRDAVRPDAVVFWPGPYGKAWLALGRPSWFSVDQGAGVVFNRGTAIEYARRELASADLRSAIDNCAMVAQPDCRIDARPARDLCARGDGPDYLVLNARIDGYSTVEWPLPPAIGPGRQSLFLYACRQFSAKEKGRR